MGEAVVAALPLRVRRWRRYHCGGGLYGCGKIIPVSVDEGRNVTGPAEPRVEDRPHTVVRGGCEQWVL